VYGRVESAADRRPRPANLTGRHRSRRPIPASVALALIVAALLAALALGAALVPSSLIGPGAPAEMPAAAVRALAPGAGGGVPGARAPRWAEPSPSRAPSASPSRAPSASPSPTRSARPKARTSTSTKPGPRRTTARPQSGLAGQENEVIRLVNAERRHAGCRSLTLNTRLRTAIRLHVAELGRHGNLYLSHVSDDGRTFVDRAKAQGYGDPGGENVARGQRDAADVMDSWMNSAGHRANIVNCSFKAIGVGVTRGVDGTLVWGQIFGRS
jgi:uncharacterized protein YkwD